MSRPLRVMMLVTDLQRGGTPMRLVNLALALRAFDVQPVVGCLAQRGPLHDSLDNAGIESFHCDATGPTSVLALRKLAKVIETTQPDVLCASLFHANLAARLVGRIDRARCIITNSATVEIERRWHNTLEALTADRSDLHVANSTAVREHLVRLGFDPQRVGVIPNGLDLDRIERQAPIALEKEGFDRDGPLVVWVGRMDPVKNLETVIRAAAALAKREIQFALIGDGRERSYMESLTERLGLTRHVRFMGWRDDVVGWFKAATCLVFPSRTEGAPNVVLEAMAAGCPVIASRIAAHEACIADGETGRLCAANDAAEFARAVEMTLDRPDVAGALATAAKGRVTEKHGLTRVAQQWATLFRSRSGE